MVDPALRRAGLGFVRLALLASAVVALPAAAALVGAHGPLVLRLNLGPGDAKYLSGFAPQYEIDNGLARHWSRRRAAVRLPLLVENGPQAVAFRSGPPPMSREQTADVRVSLGGVEVEHFPLPGGGMQEHRSPVSMTGPVPLTLGFDVTWPGTQDLGLWLDWIDFEVPAARGVALTGPERWRAATTVGLAFLTLLGAGWPPLRAAIGIAPLSVAAAFALRRDPWLVHQLLMGVPEALALFGLAVMAGVAIARHRQWTSRDLIDVSGLMLTAFLVRGVALNTPGYYYPDLRSHGRLAIGIREAGPAFLTDPQATVAKVGLWQKPLGGRIVTFPYAPGFHLPLAASSLSYEDLLTAEKLLGAAVSTLPIAFLFALARQIGASPLGALLLLTAPTYGRHLAVAFLPALFGHAWDMGFLTWLAPRLERLWPPRVCVTAALGVTACQLAYVSAVTLVPAFLVSLALSVLVLGTGPRAKSAITILGFGLAGSALSLILYYRHFLGPFLEALVHFAPASPGGGRPRGGALEAVWATNASAFPPLVLVLAVIGLTRLLKNSQGRVILSAWVLAYAVLLLGRALLPDLLQFQHEALFVTPLVFLGAGEAVAWLGAQGAVGKTGSIILVLALLATGALRHWSDLLEQLVHAR